MIRPIAISDVDLLAQLHAATFAGTLGASLGRRYLRKFFAWFVNHPSAVKLAATQDNQLAGYVFGAPDGYGTALTRRLLPAIAWGIVSHPQILLHRNFLPQLPARLGAMLRRREKPAPRASAPAGDTFALTGIGVAPAFRGRGIAGELLDAFEEEVWRRGFSRLILDVYRDNRAALALYVSRGWTESSTHGEVLRYEKSCPVSAS